MGIRYGRRGTLGDGVNNTDKPLVCPGESECIHDFCCTLIGRKDDSVFSFKRFYQGISKDVGITHRRSEDEYVGAGLKTPAYVIDLGNPCFIRIH